MLSSLSFCIKWVLFGWVFLTLFNIHNFVDLSSSIFEVLKTSKHLFQVKSGSMGKNNSHNNMLNQYAQSWVFDSDTVGSSQSDSPYNKLPSQFSGSKTVVLKRKPRTYEPTEPEPIENAQPIVLVEGSDASNSDRQLPFMTSFSRTPSPVPGTSDGDSSSQCSNPPAIYECLERLTEPSVYRARLNTAIGTNVDRVSPSVSPRPHSAVFSDRVHYASLMMELNKTIETKFPPRSQTASHRDSRRPSGREEMVQNSVSDVEFSKELEAALQLIQDLESPNTTETPSEGPSFVENEPNKALSAGKQCVIHNEGNKTIISLKAPKKYTSIVTIVPSENSDFTGQENTKELTMDTYGRIKNTKDLDSRKGNRTESETKTFDSRITIPDIKYRLVDSTDILIPPQSGRGRPLIKHKSFKEFSGVEYNNNNIHKSSKNSISRSISLTEKDTNSLTRTRFPFLKTLLKRKSSQYKLSPELESAILKSESLAHLSELELIARYNQNQLLRRVRVCCSSVGWWKLSLVAVLPLITNFFQSHSLTWSYICHQHFSLFIAKVFRYIFSIIMFCISNFTIHSLL